MARRGSSTRQLTENRKSFLKVKTKSAKGRTKGRAIEGKKTGVEKTVTKVAKPINKISAKQFDSRKTPIKKAKATVNRVAGPKVTKAAGPKVTKAKATVNKAKATPTKGTTKPSSNPKKVIKSTTKGGPVKDGVKYAQSKGDDLAGFRRGPGTKLGKDTRITKKLKKSGFTEDRLARLRKQHAEFKAKRKKK